MIKYVMKIRLSNFGLAMVTDWCDFKEKNESLADFNDWFFIWVNAFNDINEILNWKVQLVQSLLFAEK